MAERDRFDEFMDNHWPHLITRVGRIEGAMWVVGGALITIGALLGVLVSKI